MIKSVKSLNTAVASEWLKLNEAMRILGVTRNTAKRLIREGILPAYIVEGVVGYKFKRVEVEALIKRVEPVGKKGKRAAGQAAARRSR